MQQAPPVGTERVVVGSGNLSDSSSSDSTGCSRRRRTHGQSPTRVRFQDESEKDAEVRYLERQHKRAGEKVQGLLGAKPSLATYINSQRLDDKSKSNRSQEKLPVTNNYYEPETTGQQCNSCGTILDKDFSDSCFFRKQPSHANGETEGRTVPCWVAPTLPNCLVRIEQIKETYIGATSPVIVESDGTHCRAAGSVCTSRGTIQKQKRKSHKREGSPETMPSAANGLSIPGSPSIPQNTIVSNGAIPLPPNPYESLQLKVEGRTCNSLTNLKACMPSVISRGDVPGAQSVPRLPQTVPLPLTPKKSALNLESSNSQRIIMPSQPLHLNEMDSVSKDQSTLQCVSQGNINSHGQRSKISRQHGTQQAGWSYLNQHNITVSCNQMKDLLCKAYWQ